MHYKFTHVGLYVLLRRKRQLTLIAALHVVFTEDQSYNALSDAIIQSFVFKFVAMGSEGLGRLLYG